MQRVNPFNKGDQVTREMLNSYAQAILELQRLAITGANHPIILSGGALSFADKIQQAEVLVRNDTGGALTRGAVVGLDDLRDNDPSGALDAFQLSDLTFLGVTPADPGHVGKYAVLVDDLASGAIGVAMVQGAVRVQVIFTTGDEQWADITGASTSTLTAAASGSARILWRAGTGAGTVWCVCLLGCSRGEPTAPDEVAPQTYTKRFHAYQYGALNDHEVFWAIPDCHNSFIHIYAEVRECDGDGLAGDHPAYQGYVYNGKYQGTSIVCGSAGHDNWVSLPNTIVYKTRTTPDVEQEAQGSQFGSSATGSLLVRVSAAGNLEFSMVVNSGDFKAVVYLKVVVTPFDPTMDMVEIGMGNNGEYGYEVLHEPGGTWNDDEWTPTS